MHKSMVILLVNFGLLFQPIFMLDSIERKVCSFQPEQIYMNLDLMEKTNKKNSGRRSIQKDSVLNYIRQQRFNNRYCLTDRAKHYDALADPYTSYYFSSRSVKDHLKKFKRAILEEPNFTEKRRINKLVTLRIKESFKDYVCPKTLVYEKEMTNLELDILGKKSTAGLNNIKSKQSLTSNSTHHDGALMRNIVAHEPSKTKPYLRKMQPLNNTSSQQLTGVNLQNTSSEPKSREQDETILVKPKEAISGQTSKISELFVKRRKREVTSRTHLLPETEQSVSFTRNKTLNKETNEQKLFADRLAEQLHQKKHDKWLQFLQEKKKLLTKAREQQVPQEHGATNPETGV